MSAQSLTTGQLILSNFGSKFEASKLAASADSLTQNDILQSSAYAISLSAYAASIANKLPSSAAIPAAMMPAIASSKKITEEMAEGKDVADKDFIQLAADLANLAASGALASPFTKNPAGAVATGALLATSASLYFWAQTRQDSTTINDALKDAFEKINKSLSEVADWSWMKATKIAEGTLELIDAGVDIVSESATLIMEFLSNGINEISKKISDTSDSLSGSDSKKRLDSWISDSGMQCDIVSHGESLFENLYEDFLKATLDALEGLISLSSEYLDIFLERMTESLNDYVLREIQSVLQQYEIAYSNYLHAIELDSIEKEARDEEAAEAYLQAQKSHEYSLKIAEKKYNGMVAQAAENYDPESQQYINAVNQAKYIHEHEVNEAAVALFKAMEKWESDLVVSEDIFFSRVEKAKVALEETVEHLLAKLEAALEILIGDDSNDNLELETSDDGVLLGKKGDDSLIGNTGNDVIFGGDGNDNISTGDGDDLVSGGTGNDVMTGGSGNDTYLIEEQSGDDIIYESDHAGNDEIKLTNTQSISDVSISRDRKNLYIRQNSTGDTLTVKNYQSLSSDGTLIGAIDSFEFADGSRLSFEAVKTLAVMSGSTGRDVFYGDDQTDDLIQGNAGNDDLRGRAGNDTIKGGDHNDFIMGEVGDDLLRGDSGDDHLDGGDGADLLTGGLGSDSLSGGAGNDVYVYSKGDGNDRVSGVDLTGHDVLQLKDVNLSDVTLTRDSSKLVITINDTGESITLDGYQKYIGQGGYSGVIDELEFADGSRLNFEAVKALAMMNGSTARDVFYGDDQTDDLMQGNAGNDELRGRGGNDTINGGDHNDFIMGEAGDDVLHGDSGDDRLSGGDGNDLLNGGTGNDSLSGDSGDDVFVYSKGDGNDRISGVDLTGHDVLQLKDVNLSDVTLTRDSSKLVITINDTGESITLDGYQKYIGQGGYSGVIDELEFADGSRLNFEAVKALAMMNGSTARDVFYGDDQTDDLMQGNAGNDELRGRGGNDTINGGDHNDFIMGEAGDDVLHGDSGDDRLSGGDGNDLLNGGTGNDSLSGDSGDDVFVYSKGDGNDRISGVDLTGHDVLQLKDVNLSDVTLTRDSSKLVITINDTGESITLDGYQKYIGQGGYSGVIDELEFADGSRLNFEAVKALAMMNGSTARDVFYGDDQTDDLMQGNAGNDELRGRGGNDTINGGDHNDFIMGEAGDDVLQGDSGDDHLDGGDGLDLLVGGTGNDRLNGGAGSDTFVFHKGDGNDTVYSSTQEDVMKILGTESSSDLWFTRSSSDLLVDRLDSDDSIRLSGWFSKTSSQTATIETDRDRLLNDRLNELVDIMATMEQPDADGATLSDEDRARLSAAMSVAWESKDAPVV